MSRKKKDLPLLRDLEIVDVAAEGNAIARVRLESMPERSMVVFVPYASPGDICDVQVTKRRKSYMTGRMVELKRASDERRKPACDHFGVCGGCRWQHIAYERQLVYKRNQVKDVLDRIAKIEYPGVNPTLGSADTYHYRNKMEYTFSNKKWRTREEISSGEEFGDSSNALGFHIPGSFDKVLHIGECHLQDALGDRIRNAVFEFAERHGYSFYDIKGRSGELRTLMIRLSSTGEAMACLSFATDDFERIEPMMAMLAEKFPEVTSLLYVVNQKANDTIGDLDIEVFKGREYIEEEMEGLRFRVHAKSFYQTNSRQALELYRTARDFAFRGRSDKPVVYDLYTGAGTIANFVASRASKVVGIEYVEDAVRDARINSEVNGVENTEFYSGDMKDVLTDEFITVHGHPDVMIIDPPRAGMHPDVVATVMRAKPETIVYVSCNPGTQARDLAMLDAEYRVTDVQPVDMFPHTHHVENVVRLERR